MSLQNRCSSKGHTFSFVAKPKYYDPKMNPVPARSHVEPDLNPLFLNFS